MLQSKKVKLVATKSGPFWTLTESLEVKWDSPEGMMGRRSFLEMRSKFLHQNKKYCPTLIPILDT